MFHVLNAWLVTVNSPTVTLANSIGPAATVVSLNSNMSHKLSTQSYARTHNQYWCCIQCLPNHQELPPQLQDQATNQSFRCLVGPKHIISVDVSTKDVKIPRIDFQPTWNGFPLAYKVTEYRTSAKFWKFIVLEFALGFT